MAGRPCVDGICRTPCPTMTDAECASIDSQLPLCRPDSTSGVYYCYAMVETAPECRVAADCGAGRECLNGTCRNSP
jgi:hypothetical protein